MSYDPQPGDIPSYPQRGEPGRGQDAYPQQDGYGQEDYPQGGYPRSGYDQPGYDQGGYPDDPARQGQYQQAGWGPRSGPSLFPFPSWTTRTRGGSTVTVGGCCLPLPIGCLATTLAVGALAGSRAVRHLRG